MLKKPKMNFGAGCAAIAMSTLLAGSALAELSPEGRAGFDQMDTDRSGSISSEEYTVWTTRSGGSGKEAKTTTVVEAEVKKVVSGVLNLDYNTHFISYGSDVWAAGNNWDDSIFNPSLELSLDLGKGFSFILGTWWDVNDNADTNLGGGGGIQEVDVWAGFAYKLDKVSFKLLYQEWLFGGGSERIVDFTVAVDTILNPSLTVHGRVDGQSVGLNEGVVVVLGISEGFEAGPVTFSFPVAVAYVSDDYHFGDGGFGYVSAGIGASVPLKFLPGDWSLRAGVTGYYTDENVIPNNPDEAFITGNTGLTLTF